MGNHLISRVHPSKDSASFLDLYPANEIIGDAVPMAQPEVAAIPKSSSGLKLTALALELEMEMESEVV